MRFCLLSATSATMLLMASGAFAQDNSTSTDKFKPRIYGGPIAQSGIASTTSAKAEAKTVRAGTQTSDAELERVIEEANRIRNYQGATRMDAPTEEGQKQPLPTIATQILTHSVKKGDTLYNLSKRYDVEIADIQNANKLSDNGIEIGQSLMIPAKSKSLTLQSRGEKTVLAENQADNSESSLKRVVLPAQAETDTIYAVLPKDTLYSISKRSCVDMSALVSANGISDPNTLKPGQKLVLPEGHCLER